jgi:hypothetical protein
MGLRRVPNALAIIQTALENSHLISTQIRKNEWIVRRNKQMTILSSVRVFLKNVEIFHTPRWV